MACRLVQSQFVGFLQEYWNIFLVESAEDERGVGIHHTTEETHIIEQDVAVDVGHHHVEYTADVIEYAAISKEHFHIVYTIEQGIVLGILRAPFIDVISHYFLGT